MNYNDTAFDFENLNIRKSVFDLQAKTLDNEYPGLPEELKPFHYYFAHEGHVIMIIPRNYLDVALGYEFVDGHYNYIVGNFDYDDELQRVDVPVEYYEY